MNLNQRPDRQRRMRMGQSAKRYGVDIDCVCPVCFGLLKVEYENNGFTPPDPDKIEVSYLLCPNCGYKQL